MIPYQYLLSCASRGSSAGIATDWAAGVRFLGGARFSLLHGVHTASGAHTASYPMGNGGHSPGGEAAGA
jgi:hypothetical protein